MQDLRHVALRSMGRMDNVEDLAEPLFGKGGNIVGSSRPSKAPSSKEEDEAMGQ